MKLEIYEPKKVEKKEEPVRLKLVARDDEIQLMVVNEDGEWENTLLIIYSDGIIELCSGVNENLGFQFDDDGYLKVEKN